MTRYFKQIWCGATIKSHWRRLLTERMASKLRKGEAAVTPEDRAYFDKDRISLGDNSGALVGRLLAMFDNILVCAATRMAPATPQPVPAQPSDLEALEKQLATGPIADRNLLRRRTELGAITSRIRALRLARCWGLIRFLLIAGAIAVAALCAFGVEILITVFNVGEILAGTESSPLMMTVGDSAVAVIPFLIAIGVVIFTTGVACALYRSGGLVRVGWLGLLAGVTLLIGILRTATIAPELAREQLIALAGLFTISVPAVSLLISVLIARIRDAYAAYAVADAARGRAIEEQSSAWWELWLTVSPEEQMAANRREALRRELEYSRWRHCVGRSASRMEKTPEQIAAAAVDTQRVPLGVLAADWARARYPDRDREALPRPVTAPRLVVAGGLIAILFVLALTSVAGCFQTNPPIGMTTEVLYDNSRSAGQDQLVGYEEEFRTLLDEWVAGAAPGDRIRVTRFGETLRDPITVAFDYRMLALQTPANVSRRRLQETMRRQPIPIPAVDHTLLFGTLHAIALNHVYDTASWRLVVLSDLIVQVPELPLAVYRNREPEEIAKRFESVYDPTGNPPSEVILITWPGFDSPTSGRRLTPAEHERLIAGWCQWFNEWGGTRPSVRMMAAVGQSVSGGVQ